MISVFQEVTAEDEVRIKQMKRLRQICIPRLCFLLHSVLHSSQLYKDVSQCVLHSAYMYIILRLHFIHVHAHFIHVHVHFIHSQKQPPF